MSLNPILLVLLVIALLAAWWWFKTRQQSPSRAENADRLDTLAAWPPQVTRIMTTQERLAHGLLVRAFPDHIILAQVPLSRFLRVPTRHSHAEWLRRVGQLCVDLVVCDTASQPLAAIIVQSPGGAKNERARIRHERLLRVLRAADVRCHVWVENALPSIESVHASVLDLQVDRPPPAATATTAVAAPRVAQGATAPNAFDDTRRDSTHAAAGDEQDPPSTWYDDIGSGPAPLQSSSRPNDPPKR